MINNIIDLEKSIRKKKSTISVSKDLLDDYIKSNSNTWTNIGFNGIYSLIENFNYFIMSLFSSDWKKAYVEKKLFYYYSIIDKTDAKITFKLNN